MTRTTLALLILSLGAAAQAQTALPAGTHCTLTDTVGLLERDHCTRL